MTLWTIHIIWLFQLSKQKSSDMMSKLRVLLFLTTAAALPLVSSQPEYELLIFIRARAANKIAERGLAQEVCPRTPGASDQA